MSIHQITTEHSRGVVTGAAIAKLPLLDELRKINYWPQRIAKIEEALSNARRIRHAARMQLMQPQNSGALPSEMSLYADACATVALWEQELNDALNTLN
ncbi:MAG: hypothetical protein ACLP4V_02325 [Methylocella sp.]